MTVAICSLLALSACGGHSSATTASLFGPDLSGSADHHAGSSGVYTFDFSAYPADIRPKLLADAGEGMACRGTARDGPQTIAACDRLQTIHEELQSKGWCRGPDSAPPANRHWMSCGPEATPDS
jgi:hypothetical protein